MFEAKNPLAIILGFIAIAAIVFTSLAGLNLIVYAFLDDKPVEIRENHTSDLITQADH
jgi:hypothetical protein